MSKSQVEVTVDIIEKLKEVLHNKRQLNGILEIGFLTDYEICDHVEVCELCILDKICQNEMLEQMENYVLQIDDKGIPIKDTYMNEIQMILGYDEFEENLKKLIKELKKIKKERKKL